jgi:hypothetical protein
VSPPPAAMGRSRGQATESFCIRDANGQALAYVYFEFEDETGPRAAARQAVPPRRVHRHCLRGPPAVSKPTLRFLSIPITIPQS